MKVTYLITVTNDYADPEAVDDYLTGVIYMPGIQKVRITVVPRRKVKAFWRRLGF